MTVNYNPKIVTDGLILCLDAENPKSYPGTGTTWFDLSGNNINFQIVGSVTYSSGYFSNFSNSNYFDIVNSSDISKLPTGSSDRTVLSLCRTPTGYPSSYNHVFHYGTASNGQAFGISVTGTRLGTHPWVGSPISNESIPTNTNMFLGVSYTQSNSLHSFYMNQTQLTSNNATRTITTGSSQARIGSRISTPTETWQTTGRIMTVMVYNRVLTLPEIKQNYNALRGRLNI